MFNKDSIIRCVVCQCDYLKSTSMGVRMCDSCYQGLSTEMFE